MSSFWREINYWRLAPLSLFASAIYFVPLWSFRRVTKRWPQYLDSLKEMLTFSRLALVTVAFEALPAPAPHAQMERLRQAVAYLHVYVLLFFVVLCIWLVPRWIAACILNRWRDHPEAIKQARTLIRILLAALLLDEGAVRVRIYPLPASLREIYTLTYAAKWEFFALLATAVITWEYGQAHKKRIKKIQKMNKDHYAKTADYLNLMWISIVLAFGFFILAIVSWSEPLFYWTFYLHLACLIALSLFFWRADHHIYSGIPPRQPRPEVKELLELKHLSHNLVYLVDIPAFVSLCLLGIFLPLHWAEHYFGQSLNGFLVRPPRSLEPVNVWTSENYFVSGMIAFQFLTMTVVSVILGFNPKPEVWTSPKRVSENGKVNSARTTTHGQVFRADEEETS